MVTQYLFFSYADNNYSSIYTKNVEDLEVNVLVLFLFGCLSCFYLDIYGNISLQILFEFHHKGGLCRREERMRLRRG